jgi:hypothetical protein
VSGFMFMSMYMSLPRCLWPTSMSDVSIPVHVQMFVHKAISTSVSVSQFHAHLRVYIYVHVRVKYP